jgi:murein DD-endopeptidase MepM/ murein hydrolase activator NlpD
MSGRAAAPLALVAVAAFVAACSSPSPYELPPARGTDGAILPPTADETEEHGQIHYVRRGENLWRISKRYGTTVDALVRKNGIDDVTELRVGQRLLIPDGATPAPRSPNTWSSADPRGRTGTNRFIWPVRGNVTSSYGLRNMARHDGIDISARPGTLIRAAEAGRVVHSDDELSGYGNMIILKHSGAYATVYAHNHRNLVEEGQFVEKGDVIGEVGQTGRASAPHVHFEVRRNGSPQNPLDYLP